MLNIESEFLPGGNREWKNVYDRWAVNLTKISRIEAIGHFGSVLARFTPFLLTLLLSCCASTSNLIPESDLHSLLKIVEKKAYVVGQFQADFHKVRKSNLFEHETRMKGRLIFQKPGRFQLRLTGDVNLDILSDGDFVALIHDNNDLEFYKTQGERNLSRLADPMMMIVNSLSNGDTSRFAEMKQQKLNNAMLLEIDPGDIIEFESIQKVNVKFSEQGTIESIEIFFRNGNVEKTVFDSWSLLTQDDPEIIKMNQRIKKLSALNESVSNGVIYRLKTGELLFADSSNRSRANHLSTSSLSSRLDSQKNNPPE